MLNRGTLVAVAATARPQNRWLNMAGPYSLTVLGEQSKNQGVGGAMLLLKGGLFLPLPALGEPKE